MAVAEAVVVDSHAAFHRRPPGGCKTLHPPQHGAARCRLRHRRVVDVKSSGKHLWQNHQVDRLDTGKQTLYSRERSLH